jgi:hypothetical protein
MRRGAAKSATCEPDPDRVGLRSPFGAHQETSQMGCCDTINQGHTDRIDPVDAYCYRLGRRRAGGSSPWFAPTTPKQSRRLSFLSVTGRLSFGTGHASLFVSSPNKTRSQNGTEQPSAPSSLLANRYAASIHPDLPEMQPSSSFAFWPLRLCIRLNKLERAIWIYAWQSVAPDCKPDKNVSRDPCSIVALCLVSFLIFLR